MKYYQVLPGFRRCDADDDVKIGRAFADLRTTDRREIHHHQFAIERIADFPEHAVAAILRMTVDEQLGAEQFLAAALDLDVNVGCATGIRHGLDGAEVVFAALARGAAPETLEVGVALATATAIGAVQV